MRTSKYKVAHKDKKINMRISDAEKEVFFLKTGNISKALRIFVNSVNTNNIELIKQFYKH